MDEHSLDVMVALRPIIAPSWVATPLPHLTLAHMSKVNLKPGDFNALAKDVAGVAMKHPWLQLYTDGLEVFGEPGQEVEVIKFKGTPALMKIRQEVVSWDESTFPFNPHMTIGPRGTFTVGTQIPYVFGFDRIMFTWNGEEINYWLAPRG